MSLYYNPEFDSGNTGLGTKANPYNLNQPFHATVQLAIYAPDNPLADPKTGRVIVDQAVPEKKPDHLISANVKMEVDGIGATLDLNMFDREFLPIELMLSTQAKGDRAGKEIQFRFGYIDRSGRLNPELHIQNQRWFNGKLIELVPTYQQNGVQLAVQVTANSYEGGHDRPKRRAFHRAGPVVPGGQNGKKAYYYMTIGDAVRKICEENNWKLEMRPEEEPEPMESWDSTTGTLPNPVLLVQKEGQSDMQYLQELASLSRTKAQLSVSSKGFFGGKKTGEVKNTYGGSGGYQVFYDPRTVKEGTNVYKGTLHFYPPRWIEDAVRVFHINKDEMTEVISFTPQISHGIMTKMGADACEAVCIETLSKRVSKVSASYDEEKDVFIPPDQSKTSYHYRGEIGKARRIRKVFHTKEAAKVSCKNEWYTWNKTVQSAQLVIQGDPRLFPRDNIWIFFHSPTFRTQNWYDEEANYKSIMLYSSGKYQIEGVTHTLSGGQFQTTLALKTTGTMIPMPLLENFKKL